MTNQRIFQDETVTRQWHHQLPRSKLAESGHYNFFNALRHAFLCTNSFKKPMTSIDLSWPCTYNWCVATHQQASWALACPAATASRASDASPKNSTGFHCMIGSDLQNPEFLKIPALHHLPISGASLLSVLWKLCCHWFQSPDPMGLATSDDVEHGSQEYVMGIATFK